jgi:hypothetical protein
MHDLIYLLLIASPRIILMHSPLTPSFKCLPKCPT